MAEKGDTASKDVIASGQSVDGRLVAAPSPSKKRLAGSAKDVGSLTLPHDTMETHNDGFCPRLHRAHETTGRLRGDRTFRHFAVIEG